MENFKLNDPERAKLFGLDEKPPGWDWANHEAYYLSMIVGAAVNLFLTVYVLYKIAVFENREGYPREIAQSLGKSALVEIIFGVPVLVLFGVGGYVWETVGLAVAVLWVALRFALGWTEIDPKQLGEKKRFLQTEAYVKMALWFAILIWGMVCLIEALENAYSSHKRFRQHMHKHFVAKSAQF